MLRCQRAIRILGIEMNTKRLMYLKLWASLKMMECRTRREDVKSVILTLITDEFECERDGLHISACLREALQKVMDQIGAKLAVAETRMNAAN